ncbi:MAG: hypothetical protein FWC40_09815, partial [Proteobacteria bacterium]|nr:hypothetical protein [Pseudomonadota bacterium]
HNDAADDEDAHLGDCEASAIRGYPHCGASIAGPATPRFRRATARVASAVPAHQKKARRIGKADSRAHGPRIARHKRAIAAPAICPQRALTQKSDFEAWQNNHMGESGFTPSRHKKTTQKDTDDSWLDH